MGVVTNRYKYFCEWEISIHTYLHEEHLLDVSELPTTSIGKVSQ
jgi:hypothetical protein